ncbi:hypothetical protein [Thermovenabulum gondwanense]|uniref:hypothetical protein n=1 Tax=Thermovenabulum gondwanense TaxID=520767 RepID=UPI0008384240|nr:hypothetical protein [Thermovenabulum gondwanense]
MTGIELKDALEILNQQNVEINSIKYLFPFKEVKGFTREVVVRVKLINSKADILVAYFKP